MPLNLPVPDPILVNRSIKNCDGDAPTSKKRKLTTVEEYKDPDEPGDLNRFKCKLFFMAHIYLGETNFYFIDVQLLQSFFYEHYIHRDVPKPECCRTRRLYIKET